MNSQCRRPITGLVRASTVILALLAQPAFAMDGVASYYGDAFEGRRMADGCRFHSRLPSAASRSLPLGTRIRVRSHATGRSVDVVVRDRGPYWPGRDLDLSLHAADRLGMRRAGLAAVSIEPLSVEALRPCPMLRKHHKHGRKS